MKKRRKMTGWVSTLILLAAALLGINRQSITKIVDQATEQIEVAQPAKNKHKGIQNVADTHLSQLTFKSGDAAYMTVNDNKSKLQASDWRTNKIVYGDLDRLNRTTMATGYLEQRNLVKSSTRSSQAWRPTGWHQKAISRDGHRVEILNRGHLLAYSITGKFDQDGRYRPGALGSIDNPKNLATQTEFSNQRTMQIFEEKVRQALGQNKRVIYQVSTVFKKEDLMPVGYHLQALSTDGDLNFNVFVWNVEPGVQFDYATGRSRIDRSMRVAESNP